MLIRNTRDLGTLLRQRRRSRQLSQQALADAIGVSRHWVMDLERGKPTLEVGLVLRAITALGLTTDLQDADRTAVASSAGTYSSMIDLEQVLSKARGRSLAIAQRPSPYMTKEANKPETSAAKRPTREKNESASDGRTEGPGR